MRGEIVRGTGIFTLIGSLADAVTISCGSGERLGSRG